MIAKRVYKQSDKISLIGLGGIVLAKLPPNEANALAREAFDRGINYFDVAPTYWDAEERMGPAIQSFRNELFLACKTTQRGAKEAQRELDESLRKLKTDHFDLYQLHGMSKMEEVEQVFAPGGAMELFLKAREQGKTRYLGFSALSEEVALELIKRFSFDSALFPLNFVTLLRGQFGWKLLEEAPKKGVTLLALKVLARRQWAGGAERLEKCWYEPIRDPEWGALALRYTLSLRVASAIPPGDEHLFRMAMSLAERFRPITKSEEAKLRKEAEKLTPIFGKVV